MRTFIGISFPEEYKKILKNIKQKWQNRLLSKIKWTEEKNFHLTLFFIGEVNEISVNNIKHNISKISTNSFTFQAGGGGFFPDIKRPRVIWVGSLKGGKECSKLSKQIIHALEDIGIMRDDKPFKAHLTLGRIKYCNYKDPWGEFLHYLNKISWPEIKISNFTLWKSTLTPSGPIYTSIEEFQLSNL